MRTTLPLLLACCLTGTQAATPLPPQVRAVIDGMKAECLSAGGKPDLSSDLLQSADLNGDGRPDHVIHEAAFECAGAASLFSGTGGGQVTVFITNANGGAARAFEHGAQGVRIEGSEVWLAVGGPLCSQKTNEDTPRSAMQSCWRPLQWQAAKRTLDFAPLARIKPYR
jgi:hypothetical protein